MSLERIDSQAATSMSDASRSISSADRPLTAAEAALVEALLDMIPGSTSLRSGLSVARVQEMKDGGMGSLRFTNGATHHMDREAVTATSVDEDGVPISIALNLDENGDLFELDIWKVDFSPLCSLPKPEQVQRV